MKVAEFSPDRIYRYTLWRDIATDLFDTRGDRGPNEYVAWIGLNPSTADETKDDPTLRKCQGFTKRFGYNRMCMLNLFAFRQTDPNLMRAHPSPIGADNNRFILEVASGAAMVVAAWGVHGTFLDRGATVAKTLTDSRITLHCLRLTQRGYPEHPLYVPYDIKPIPFP